MEALFEGLTESEIEYLTYVKEKGYFDGIEMFMNLDTSSDYRIEKLRDGDYISFDGQGPYPGSIKISITGKGMAALIDFSKYKNQVQPLKDEIIALNKISESLSKQVDLAEQSANESDREAKFSKILAIVSLVVSVLAILPDVISLLIGI